MEKVTFFINSLDGGGAERVCVTLANGFCKSGVAVDIYVLNLENAILKSDLNTNVCVINLNVGHARFAFLRLLQIINKKSPDKIISFSYQLSALLVMVRPFVRRTFFIISRNVSMLSKVKEFQDSYWHRYLIFNLTHLFYKKIDLFIAQCVQMKQDIIKTYNIHPDKIEVVYNPVNPLLFEKKTDQNIRLKEILYVGRLSKEKALYDLIDIFNEVHQNNDDYILRIIGKGSLKGDLEAYGSKLGLSDCIIWNDFEKDIARYYCRAKLVVLTSHYEGFPNVLIEAISLGTPIIAFDCPSGPSEIIVDDVNGYLIHKRDKNMFAMQIIKGLSKTWDRKKIKDSALPFLLHNIKKQYLKVIKNV